MNLVDVYLKMCGAEKTAAVQKTEDADLDKVIAQLGMADQVKTAEDRETVKLALSYDLMGREYARQVFVTEILGQPAEKTAAVIEEILAAPAAAEKTAAEGKAEEKLAEKTAATGKGSNEVEDFLASVGLVEKKAATKVEPAADAEKTAEEEKKAALRELVSKLVSSAKGGLKKAAVALQKISASSPENKTVVANAIKNHGKGDGKSDNLAKFLAKRKGDQKKAS